MLYQDDMRRCLDELDVPGIRKLWRTIRPEMPQPESDGEALISLHYARTQAISIDFDKRAYSHRWLVDHGYPSGMPDELKPRAERIYPKIVSAVGVSVNSMTEAGQPLAKAMERAMSDAVAECYADGKTDPEFVRARMNEARDRFLRSS